MLDQLIMHVRTCPGCQLVPILIKVQSLQRSLLQFERIYAAAWNWVAAYLRLLLGADSPLYRMLLQALIARCALILLDGIDEAGTLLEQIVAHITEVLEPQGHIMVVTSRPASVNAKRFLRFEKSPKFVAVFDLHTSLVVAFELCRASTLDAGVV